MKGIFMKVVTMVMVLTVLFSVNVMAAEDGVVTSGMQRAYEGLKYNQTESYVFVGSAFGKDHELVVNVRYTLDYSYADGSWAQINYVNIEIVSAYIDGEQVADSKIQSVGYDVYSDSASRRVRINDVNIVTATISIDEYGEVRTDATYYYDNSKQNTN